MREEQDMSLGNECDDLYTRLVRLEQVHGLARDEHFALKQVGPGGATQHGFYWPLVGRGEWVGAPSFNERKVDMVTGINADVRERGDVLFLARTWESFNCDNPFYYREPPVLLVRYIDENRRSRSDYGTVQVVGCNVVQVFWTLGELFWTLGMGSKGEGTEGWTRLPDDQIINVALRTPPQWILPESQTTDERCYVIPHGTTLQLHASIVSKPKVTSVSPSCRPLVRRDMLRTVDSSLYAPVFSRLYGADLRGTTVTGGSIHLQDGSTLNVAGSLLDNVRIHGGTEEEPVILNLEEGTCNYVHIRVSETDPHGYTVGPGDVLGDFESHTYIRVVES